MPEVGFAEDDGCRWKAEAARVACTTRWVGDCVEVEQ
jgi:hypothetical protein